MYRNISLLCAACAMSMCILCGVKTAYAQDAWDPFEPVNRGVFWFNDRFDRYILEPVAEGYVEVLPGEVRTGIANVLDNLEVPIDAGNALLQLKFEQFFEQTGRFILNSTVGLAGIFDVASDVGLVRHEEDFGITLAHYCVPPGPYIVLPFLGPSNVRDTVGRVGNLAFDPMFWATQAGLKSSEETAISVGGKTLDIVDTRARFQDAFTAARESSVDYYLFMQSAYYQRRRGLLYDGNPPEEEEDFDNGESAPIEQPQRRTRIPSDSMMAQ